MAEISFGDIFDPKLGQKRREWLAEKERQASDLARYYLGPAYAPLGAAANAVAALSDPADVVDYVGAAKRLPQSQNWQEAVSNTGQLATAGAAMLVPGVSARMAEGAVDFAGDAARFMRDQSGAVGIDPISQRGDDILQRLRTDPASVTDEMLDMGDTTQNARLNEYLFNNYDLPMDEASRMARAEEMGFDTDAYHGSHADFPSFSKDADTEVNFGGNQWEIGHFLTNSPRYAGQYSKPAYNGQPGGPAVLALRPRGNFEIHDADLIDEIETNWTPGDAAGWRKSAESRGADGVTFSGVRYEGQKRIDETAIFDPSNIRSRFARFDPRLAHLRNLSAGLAGGMIMGPPVLFHANEDRGPRVE